MGIHTSVYDANMQLPTTPDLLKAAGVKSLRYPGGSYADLYHWSTAHGDVHARRRAPAATASSSRPTRTSARSWLFMEKVGANALITVNYGMNS